MIDRRQFISHIGLGAGSLSLIGCGLAGRDDLTGWIPPDHSWPAVDLHAHFFNASDLPIEGFLRRVIFGIYDEQLDSNGKPSSNAPKCEDSGASGLTVPVLECLAKVLAGIMIDGVVTARQELDSFLGVKTLKVQSEGDRPNAIAKELRSLLSHAPIRTQSLVGQKFVTDALNTQSRIESRIELGRDEFRAKLESELNETAKGVKFDLTKEKDIDRAAYEVCGNMGFISRHLCWANDFRRPRQFLAGKIEDFNAANKTPVRLFSSHLVNFAYWVNDKIISPLKDQVEVMEKISVRAGSAKIHSFVPFCPLDDMVNNGASLALVRDAILKRGFIGTKIYPPMGYLPYKNEGSGLAYPSHIKKLTESLDVPIPFQEFPGRLDQHLAGIYKFASDNDIPILTHALNSQAAGPCYGERANPKHWEPVLSAFPKLKVIFAHFGSFKCGADVRKVCTSKGAGLESTWEWKMAAMAKKQMESGGPETIFIDISYFSELHEDGSAGLTKYRAFREAVGTMLSEPGFRDTLVRRLVYGSDWILLGREAHNEMHHKAIFMMFVELGLNADELRNIFSDNAARFLGLKSGGGNRNRLEAWYGRNGLSSDWLKKFDG